MTQPAQDQYASMDVASLDALINKQGEHIRSLKASSVAKDELKPEVDKLKAMKDAFAKMAIAAKEADAKKKFDRPALESLMSKRFFVAPSFQIYGGVAGLYDYGPTGCALQSNILSLWRQHFVLEEDMLEVDCTNLTPYEVLKTSGHVDKFADYMVRDEKNGEIFRADHLIKNVLKARLEDDETLRSKGVKIGQKAPKGFKGEVLEESLRKEYELILESLDNYDGEGFWELIQKYKITSPEANNPVTKPQLFNLMFDTSIGPTGQLKGFLRPETAQGHFLNFKKLIEFNNERMPFASASIGKSFRNEISPRAGLLRVREFTMAEIEHYVDPLNKRHPRFNEVRDMELSLYPGERQLAGAGPITMKIGEAVEKGIVNNETLGYFICRINLFLLKIGIKPERLRFRQHLDKEMAHYACDCWDAEIESSYGWVECVGCADRSAYDLTVHSKRTNEKLVVRETLPEPIITERWVLNVNRSKMGPVFKKDAKFVEGYFETLYVDDCTSAEKLFDEKKLMDLKAKLEQGNGKTTITGSDGKPYEITSEMVSVAQRTEKISVREYIPSVIEPSFGIGRILYSLLEHSYWVREGDEQRAVLSFPTCVAPIKCLITPISHNDAFEPCINDIARSLRKAGVAARIDDSAASIGKRYARNDEIGTPLGITIDFQTIKDGTVTLRERDSTRQIREKVETIVTIVKDLVEERTTWAEVSKQYPEFVQQEL